MSIVDELPEKVVTLLRSGAIAQYVTVSAAGIPIDTPILYFPDDDLRSFNLATGLAYPAKAERARRNPKVGMLIEGRPGEPVISIAGMAAVRDADIQDNVHRYLAESAHTLPFNPDWSLARQAVWYWSRIIIEVAPARIDWWDDASQMDGPPHSWEAPAETRFPNSDPAPSGKVSGTASWDQPPWQQLAEAALARNAAGHLSVIDDQGFPRPIRATAISPSETGFSLSLPGGLPWRLGGKACLTFGGIETFLGTVKAGEGGFAMQVERALPLFPMTQDQKQLWHPAPHTRAELMRRLEEELERRGQSVPKIPLEKPAPSDGYRRRLARMQG